MWVTQSSMTNQFLSQSAHGSKSSGCYRVCAPRNQIFNLFFRGQTGPNKKLTRPLKHMTTMNLYPSSQSRNQSFHLSFTYWGKLKNWVLVQAYKKHLMLWICSKLLNKDLASCLQPPLIKCHKWVLNLHSSPRYICPFPCSIHRNEASTVRFCNLCLMWFPRWNPHNPNIQNQSNVNRL